MSISVKEAIELGFSILRNNGINSAKLDSSLLLRHVLGCSAEQIILKSCSRISKLQLEKFEGLIERRSKLEPIAYILGKKEFYGIEFYVDKNVLIPRPDSEAIIDEVRRIFPSDTKLNVLELGVGSGCLLLTILKFFPNASGVALDISEGALSVTRKNYSKIGLDNPIEYINKPWNDLKISSKFDLIISNPPYIKTQDIEYLQKDVREYEPAIALDGGLDGLDSYKEVSCVIKKYLSNTGAAILECGVGQHEEIAMILERDGLEVVRYLKDLSSRVRCIIASYVEKG